MFGFLKKKDMPKKNKKERTRNGLISLKKILSMNISRIIYLKPKQPK